MRVHLCGRVRTDVRVQPAREALYTMIRKRDQRLVRTVAYLFSALVVLSLVLSLLEPVLFREPATPTPTWPPTWTPTSIPPTRTPTSALPSATPSPTATGTPPATLTPTS